MFAICHQLPLRSFLWLWDPPLLCARCTGFYFAILMALTLTVLQARRARTWFRGAVVAGLLAIAAIVAEKFLDLELGNWGRSLTALPLGFAIGLGLAMPFMSRQFKEE